MLCYRDRARWRPRVIVLTLALMTFALVIAAPAGLAQEDEEPEATVTFHDQATDGSQVEVASVSMSEGGFVAIHDQRLYTGPVDQSVAGVSDKLAAGTHENVTVDLSPAIETTQTLIAMPHLDSDDNDRFEYFETNRQEDPAYQEEDGAVTDEAEVEVQAGSPAPTVGLVVLILAALAAGRARASP